MKQVVKIDDKYLFKIKQLPPKLLGPPYPPLDGGPP